ncbi:RrF2 family transcriptional regulator [Prauserella rugosa]|uniref:Transcriptional regulator, BadM/Rrf2 family n=1 Tax=Prauserella rugosa TaxID=43354 RepID=A0A660C7J0_9PSEU|nr:Rrf2 family transcriptional regulator [Prauserella rugosa]KID31637.1 transcriptional regulator, BadM/Rrf2 family [Prauserella sp. Am3]KMS87497.1 Rrf2 family transcriptional regulator [Streptomyces regensis]TWH19452.1 transcriptional regulator, BadM/Rrf2 family [Prauserella rugosa]
MLDIRFSSALKAMLYLAVAAERDAPDPSAHQSPEQHSPTLSSAQLAEVLGTNPSLVRKLLVPLVRAGLVESTKGRAGGARLAKPASQITLAEIYRCSVGDKPLWACRPDGAASCEVTANTAEFFSRLSADTEDAVLDVLGRRTLADSLAEVRSLGSQTPAG